MKRWFAFLFGFFFVAVVSLTHGESEPSGPAPGAVWVVEINSAIGPAVSDYLLRAFNDAHTARASLIVIRMDTPGGLDTSMRDIIQGILASPVPIATYVSPKGSRAASAGTYILYASHIAAMAPATNLGAATPIQIGAPSLPTPPVSEDEEGESSDTGSTAMERKMVNDASAYIRGLAELRNRNAQWAESAVRNAASLSSDEALEQSVIDLIATDLYDLLAQLDGQSIQLDSGDTVLELADAPIYVHEPDWRTDLLTTLTNPNLVLILGMLGIYGIILEFYNPGAMVPGVVGVICLLLAGYSLQLLPVNYAGLGLLIFGIGLMVAEAMAPSFGIMGIGGIISFTLGGIILFDTDIEAFQLGWPFLATVAVISATFIIVTAQIAFRIHKKKLVSGITMINQKGEALEDIADEGLVRIGSEIWKASTSEPLNKGEKVRVVKVDGLALSVRKEDA